MKSSQWFKRPCPIRRFIVTFHQLPIACFGDYRGSSRAANIIASVETQDTTGRLIYVVDDDVAISRLVAVNLAARGYRVKQFHSGQDAVASLSSDQPNMIVLDLLMPDIDGLEIAKTIRRFSRVPILVLSVQDEPATKLAALDLGADDYITKPFRVEELLARIRAILRRTSSTGTDTPPPTYSYQVGDLLIDLEGMRVTSHHRPVQLTPPGMGPAAGVS